MENGHHTFRIRRVFESFLLSAGLLAFGTSRLEAQTAEFVPGTFRGLLECNSNNEESFGYFIFTLTRSGTFTGRFLLGKRAFPLHGRFNPDGSYAFQGPPPPNHLPNPEYINLQLNPADGSGDVTGTITDLTHTSTLSGERTQVFTATDPAPQHGTYTFSILSSGAPNAPKGAGFGRVIVDRLGHVSVAGVSGKGAPFGWATTLSPSGRWPLHARLPGPGGLIEGMMSFRDTGGSDFDGNVQWMGDEVPYPPVPNSYVDQFAVDTSVVGSVYQPTASRIINTWYDTNNAQLTFGGGGLDNEVDRNLSIGSHNQVAFVSRLSGDVMSLSGGTGAFIGSARLPDNSVAHFRGIFLPKQNRGYGFFVRPAGIGYVILSPAQ